MFKSLIKKKAFILTRHNANKFASLKDLLGENEFVEYINPEAQVKADKFASQKVKAETTHQVKVQEKTKETKFTLNDLKKSHKKFTDKYHVKLEVVKEQEEQKQSNNKPNQQGIYLETIESQQQKYNTFQSDLKQKLKSLQPKPTANLEEQLGLSQITPKVEDATDLKLSPASIHVNSHLSSIEEQQSSNEKTITEFMKGEHLVTTIDMPLEFYADTMNEVEHMKDQVDTAYYKLVDPNASPLMETEPAQGWRDIQSIRESIAKGEGQTADVMVHYPGSAKGLEPHHDPLNYIEWYSKNIPHHFKDIFFPDDTNQEQKELIQSDTVQELQIISGPSAVLQDSESNKQMLTSNFYDSLSNIDRPLIYQNFHQEGKLPIIPSTFPLEMNAFYDYMERWALFRSYPQMALFSKIIQIVQQTFQDYEDPSMTFDPHSSQFQLTSVYTYYSLLPKFVRENQVVINTANCLEFSQNTISYQDKMKALNYAATFALQLDDYTTSVVKNAMYTEDCSLTKQEDYLLDKWVEEGSEELFVHNEQNLIDKAKKLDLESGLEEVGEWNKPTYMKPEGVEEPLNDLPVQYYDNSDGFWDNYISYKEKIYSQADVLYSRPYFKH